MSLWIHAVFTSASDAACLGWTWMAFRVLYAFIWLVQGKFTMTILVSTIPQYSIIMYMYLTTAAQYKLGLDLKAFTNNNKYLAVAAISVGFNVLFAVLQMITKMFIKPFFFKSDKKEDKKA